MWYFCSPMSHKSKTILYYIFISATVTGIMLCILAIGSVLTSQQYDTATGNPCMSLSTGRNLCDQLRNAKIGVAVSSLLFVVTLLAHDKVLGKKQPR